MKTWSEPYHGVTHLSAAGKKSFATVIGHDGFALANFNAYPVRGSVPQQQFPSVDEAKSACETWIDMQPV